MTAFAQPSWRSTFLHTAIALAIQTGIGLLTGDWLIGASTAAGIYMGREHSQAEYRFMRNLGINRDRLPWWGGFDYSTAWTAKGIIDWAVPMVAVGILAAFMEI